MATKKTNGENGPITIKKYANRRLYNTATSSYVTLDHLCQMVQEGVDFVVYDAKTGEDITRSVLTQIIVEEEAKGQNLLPINFLRQLIGLYGDSMQWMVPQYLDQMMESFAGNQERLRQSMQESFGGMFPFDNLEKMSAQNAAMFENAIKMFSPFAAAQGGTTQGGTTQGGTTQGGTTQGEAAQGETTTAKANSGARDTGESDSLENLKAQVDLLQKQIEAISRENQKG